MEVEPPVSFEDTTGDDNNNSEPVGKGPAVDDENSSRRDDDQNGVDMTVSNTAPTVSTGANAGEDHNNLAKESNKMRSIGELFIVIRVFYGSVFFLLLRIQ